ncbi:MAG TPA: nitroreductase family deazaflavin-dependent oxidoreductase [Anaerolineae bacterium]|nr:nitroreductase family deazaflavin-dependent oxidoreductase [Anaerolineae bacterium]
MVEQSRQVRPPRGLSRLLYRFPILLYQVGLGRLFGRRFLMLTHLGRISGRPRYAVLEIIRWDETSEAYYVLSGFGRESDWVLNLRAKPEAEVTVGGHQLAVTAEFLSEGDAEREILDYARRNPFAARQLPRLIGYQVDGSEQGYRALARHLLVVRFQSREG